MSKKLTVEEKIDEAYELYLNGIIPKSTENITFSDGINIGTWLSSYKYYLKNIGKTNHKAKEIYEAREIKTKNRYRENFNQTIIEFIDLVVNNPEILYKDSNLKLSSGRDPHNWILYNRNRLYKMYEYGDECATKIVEIIQQIDPHYFDFVDVIKERTRQRMK